MTTDRKEMLERLQAIREQVQVFTKLIGTWAEILEARTDVFESGKSMSQDLIEAYRLISDVDTKLLTVFLQALTDTQKGEAA